jgi:GNAT superfamily N-acetyltransferase
VPQRLRFVDTVTRWDKGDRPAIQHLIDQQIHQHTCPLDRHIRPGRSANRTLMCRVVLAPQLTERTWALCDPTSAVHGLVAKQEDHLAGLAHLVLHPTTWATHPTCYLKDL